MENVERIFPAGASQDTIFLRTRDSYAATLSTLWTGEQMVALLQPVPWESAYIRDVLAWAVRWQASAELAQLLVPIKTTEHRDVLCQYGTIETVLAHVKFTLRPETKPELPESKPRPASEDSYPFGPVLIEPTVMAAPVLPIVPERLLRAVRQRIYDGPAELANMANVMEAPIAQPRRMKKQRRKSS